MPLYEYECAACGKRFELIRRHSDGSVDVCTLCGSGPVTRLFSSPAIQFKGSGFYITDYAKKGDGGKAEGGTGTGEGGGSAKSDKAAAEKKSDAKSDAAASDKSGGSAAKPSSGTSEAASTPAAAAAKPAAPAKD